jgi:hypothetical protein
MRDGRKANIERLLVAITFLDFNAVYTGLAFTPSGSIRFDMGVCDIRAFSSTGPDVVTTLSG